LMWARPVIIFFCFWVGGVDGWMERAWVYAWNWIGSSVFLCAFGLRVMGSLRAIWVYRVSHYM
jgi:hypothetical protein